MIFARKLIKIPEFYTKLARKCPNFYNFPKKIQGFISFFFGGGEGGRGQPPCPPSPTPMTGPQASHQLNPALWNKFNNRCDVIVTA